MIRMEPGQNASMRGCAVFPAGSRRVPAEARNLREIHHRGFFRHPHADLNFSESLARLLRPAWVRRDRRSCPSRQPQGEENLRCRARELRLAPRNVLTPSLRVHIRNGQEAVARVTLIRSPFSLLLASVTDSLVPTLCNVSAPTECWLPLPEYVPLPRPMPPPGAHSSRSVTQITAA